MDNHRSAKQACSHPKDLQRTHTKDLLAIINYTCEIFQMLTELMIVGKEIMVPFDVIKLLTTKQLAEDKEVEHSEENEMEAQKRLSNDEIIQILWFCLQSCCSFDGKHLQTNKRNVHAFADLWYTCSIRTTKTENNSIERPPSTILSVIR